MAKEFKVTPWTVTGNVDYEKLTKEFGTEPLTDEILNRIKRHTKELHVLLRRKVFFSHRDMKWLLDEYEKGNKFFLYTGRGPSGPVHIGHLIPWIFTRWLQEKFDAELWFQFTDDEKFLFRKKDELGIGEYTKIAYENALDVIALGFDPKKTHFLIDTKHAGVMYKEACKVAKKINFSMVKSWPTSSVEEYELIKTNTPGSICLWMLRSEPTFRVPIYLFVKSTLFLLVGGII